MKLSENFDLSEFTESQVALRRGIDNRPSSSIIANLKITAEGLEQVRALLNAPIIISSGYRCPALNFAVGGSMKSAHISGFAADFIAPKFGTPKQIVQKIQQSEIKYDQLIHEGTWVHISFAPTMRQQTLNATFNNGKANYSTF
jgi:zinc D-Ala-D-Ala carboxypeptidase